MIYNDEEEPITTYFRRNDGELSEKSFDKYSVYESFSSACQDVSFNSTACRNDISNRITEVRGKLSKHAEINAIIDGNYLKMVKEINKYNTQNAKLINQPYLYERIDDSGNLFTETIPSISDARITDSQHILLNQNTAYIVCSLVISSFLILAITVR
jgi:hypothetical protein